MRVKLCPRCGLVPLSFAKKPGGSATSWCWVCGRGYYARKGRVFDILVRCALTGRLVPAFTCRRCSRFSECLDAIKSPLSKPTRFCVRPEVVVFG
ncbi:MAG: hypothetical protein QW835_02605 [Candidatus Hadarchaeum sp.]